MTDYEALIRSVIEQCKHAVVWGEDLETAEERIDSAAEKIVNDLIKPVVSGPYCGHLLPLHCGGDLHGFRIQCGRCRRPYNQKDQDK